MIGKASRFLFSERAIRKILTRRARAISFAQELGLRRAAMAAALALREQDSSDARLLPWQEAVLEAIILRMCRYEDEEGAVFPAASSPEVLQAAIAFTRTMPRVTRQKLYDLLSLVELAPAVLGPQRERRRFSALEGWAQDEHLEMWRSSALEPMRGGFEGLKAVCMMGYWSQPESWPVISYSLDTQGGWRLGGEEQ